LVKLEAISVIVTVFIEGFVMAPAPFILVARPYDSCGVSVLVFKDKTEIE
jgi:hypothetical protein